MAINLHDHKTQEKLAQGVLDGKRIGICVNEYLDGLRIINGVADILTNADKDVQIRRQNPPKLEILARGSITIIKRIDHVRGLTFSEIWSDNCRDDELFAIAKTRVR